jgi:hypothetical protein
VASSPQNVKLGVCRVTFGGTDLGYTKGGVEVEVATETHEVMVDQFGNTAINEYITGRTCTAKVPLAETTLENLVAIMPGATLSGGGVKASNTYTFSAQPADGDSITLSGVVYIFKTTPTLPGHIKIQSTLAATLAWAQDLLNASLDPLVSLASFVATATTLVVQYNTEGTVGNSYTVAKTGTAISLTGTTLTGGTGSTVKRVDVTNAIGVSLVSLAQPLVLHPIANLATNQSEDFIIPLAATSGALHFAYKLDEERIYNVEFHAYPDPATKVLFKVGDPAAA